MNPIGWPTSTQKLAFARKANGLQLGNTLYYRVERANNLRLNSTYGAGSFVNTSTSNNTNMGTASGVSSDRSISFTRDGRFQAQGFVGFAGAGQYAGGYASSQSGGAGTYRIYDYTLELNYDDGRQELFTFFVHPENAGEARPGLVVFEGAGWLRRE